MSSSDSAALDPNNPFAQKSGLPYGLPDFAKIRPEHFAPAIRAGIVEDRAEIEAIANNPQPPTISNTLDALEASGALLENAVTVFFNQLSSDTSDALDALEEELTPELSEHGDFIAMHPHLYSRVRTLLTQVDGGDIEVPESTRYLLVELNQDFERAGVGLPEAQQQELREINSRISSLEAQFGRVLQTSTNESAVVITDLADLQGLAPDAIAAAAAAATQRGHDGAYVLELQLPTQQSVLAQLRHSQVRQRVHHASISRGQADSGGDTRALLLDLALLRAQKAQLLDFDHYAAYAASDGTARTTSAVMGMLDELAPRAAANAKREGAELVALASREDPNAGFNAADWSFYAEKLRHERFNLDDASLRPYLELNAVLTKGVFAAATRLYGVTFSPRTDLIAYHPDARIWEVFEEDTTPIGLFIGDFFARESKEGGAWMNNLVDQSHLQGHKPIVVNNLNIPKPAVGEAALLTWDEVITMFHEFGHALHGLFSDVHYPSQSGANVPRDFVEYPSQVNEMWAWDPALLADYAVHHKTGAQMPQAWVDTLIASRQFNEGFNTAEYLAATLLDQAWYQLTPDAVPTEVGDVEEFEQAALSRVGLNLDFVPPRYRSTYFKHVFAGGYSAGYYSYIWSEVLDAETVEWFEENGGLNRESGRRFRDAILAIGGSADPVSAFTRLRGHAPQIQPLLNRRGLTDTLAV